MYQIISKYDEIRADEWNDLVQSSDNASYFQTKSCFDFYNSLSFLTPFIFAIREKSKLLALVQGYIIADGNFVKRFFSRRAIIPGGMMIHDNAPQEAIEMLLIELNKRLSHKSIYTEFRNYNDYSSYKNAFKNTCFEYLPHLNFHIETKSIDDAKTKLTATKLRDIKTSYKFGATVEIAKKENEIFEYYFILENLYKTKIKTPLFPLDFFVKLYESKSGIFFLVKYEEKIVGGSVCVRLPSNTLYEWFVCGLDGQFKGIYPSTLATWACVEYACHYGYKRFDMMGAGKPDEGYGVRIFKSKFGGELVEHGRFLKINKPFLYNLGKSVIKFLKNRK